MPISFRRIAATTSAIALMGLGSTALPGLPADAAQPVTVGGAPMYDSRTIADNAVNSADHTTLIAAVQAAGLMSTLDGPGPFTVFAPTNAAFAKLPEGTVASLLRPENKEQLTKILTYHVVQADAMSDAIRRMVLDDGGRHVVPTVSGDELVATIDGGDIVLMDESGGTARVTIADVAQSNGVIHVIDSVLLPR